MLIALAGALLHYPRHPPGARSAPINQLLVTGGVLFFLQAAATMAFGIDFKNLGIRLGSFNVADMSFSWSRIITFLVALARHAGCCGCSSRAPIIGTAIRAIAQDRQIMPLMGVDSRKIYLVTSAIGGGLAGLAAALMVLQYDIYPQIGLQFGPLIFMICVLGGLGNMIGGFIAAFIISQFIADRLELLRDRMGLRGRVPVLHGGDLHPAAGPVRGQVVTSLRLSPAALSASPRLPLLPFAVRLCLPGVGEILPAPADPDPDLVVHLYRLVADGPLRADLARPRRLHRHRRLRDGAAVELTPASRPGSAFRSRSWSRPSSALLVGYPCFRLRITGHYFALLTLALTEFVRLCIVGLRDYTGGSLGTQPQRYGDGISLYALQFEPDRMLVLLRRARALAVRPLHLAAGSTAAWTATRSMPRARTRTRPPRSAST